MTNVPDGWSQVPISELLEENIGGVWGKPPSVEEVEVSVVRVADFRDDGTIDLPSTPRRSVTARQLQSRELRPGDIVLEKSGGGPTKPVGRAVRMRAATDHVVPTNFVQLLRPNPAVDSGFLFWWLWWSHLNGSTNEFQRATTNIRNLRTQDYLDQPCPLPPMNEQERIVAAIEEQFSRLDAAQEWLRRGESQLVALRSSVLRIALDGGWPTKRLGEIAKTSSGGTPSRKRPDYFGGPIRWVKSGELGDGRVRTTEETITELGLAESSAKVFERGTLLVALYGATVGKLGILDIDAATNQAVCAIKPGDPEMVPYLWLVLRAKRAELVAAGQGGAQPNISQAILRELRIPVPSSNEQRRIVADVERQLSLVDALQSTLYRARRRSAALRSSILRHAFRGELLRQDPADEPASRRLEQVIAERASTAPETEKAVVT
jgi:type I restriction enzyme, S subunit